MTKAELLERIDSAELSEWHALFVAEAEEAEEARLRASSPDGELHIYGRNESDEDLEDT